MTGPSVTELVEALSRATEYESIVEIRYEGPVYGWSVSAGGHTERASSLTYALMCLVAAVLIAAHRDGRDTPELAQLAELVSPPIPQALRCERCAHEATVEAGGSYYCDEHGGLDQIAQRHGLVAIRSLARADSSLGLARPGDGEGAERRREAAGG